jgi:hypothetical protein
MFWEIGKYFEDWDALLLFKLPDECFGRRVKNPRLEAGARRMLLAVFNPLFS